MPCPCSPQIQKGPHNQPPLSPPPSPHMGVSSFSTRTVSVNQGNITAQGNRVTMYDAQTGTHIPVASGYGFGSPAMNGGMMNGTMNGMMTSNGIPPMPPNIQQRQNGIIQQMNGTNGGNRSMPMNGSVSEPAPPPAGPCPKCPICPICPVPETNYFDIYHLGWFFLALVLVGMAIAFIFWYSRRTPSTRRQYPR